MQFFGKTLHGDLRRVIVFNKILRFENLRHAKFGLASAAYFLLFPELHDYAVPYNGDQGQRYLDDSIKTGHPRAFFVRGRAMMEARGKYQFSPNRDEGLKLVAVAFCGNDEEAKKFFTKTTDYGAPACT